VATPEPLEHSRRLVKAAHAEQARLERDLRRETENVVRLRSSLAETEQRVEQIRQRLDLLAALTEGEESLAAEPSVDNVVAFPEAGVEPPSGYLRGQAIRRVAARLLIEQGVGDRPIHYAEWFSLLQEAGYGISARDPLATFLTQVGRSPVVTKGGTAGLYLLDLNAAERLRVQLEELNVELLALHRGQQTIAEIADVRSRRGELVAAISRVERALEEAIETLASAAVGHDSNIKLRVAVFMHRG
jgi:hypothetical protein